MPEPSNTRDGYRVRAVIRAVSLLELLRTSKGGASLNELASRSGLAKPSVFRMLRTLEETGLVERVAGSDSYRLGVRCLELGQAYLEQTDLRREARPIMERLREEFDETVHLGMLDDELRVVYLEKLATTHAVGVMMSEVGRTAPSYCTALGRAMLSGMEGDPIAELESRGSLHKYTTSTLCDPDELRRELEKVRERGYALDLEEHEEGVRCVAAPIRDASGKTVAAVSISGPAHRLPKRLLRGELARATKAAAREIGHRLGARC
ncbi:IclR family transcriptional regulator [Rubrobacter taiwanensis]|jgi:IclR family KDG regulon transcriptional repressor|uniref:Glycerol operon regulatory protein n=1 Tax=Rubrobacter taiwanensis TaxID=185139 RepID=A0A4R1B9R6_9ACTN|nr:IclR family transcriptional regulator [Rubrobacter taiwanensis]TCJ13670.1 IclR family transcriptional regulator [Rubrobacter taiwanensis]